MDKPSELILGVLDSVSASKDVDWDEAEAEAKDPVERELLRALRDIELIGELHRSYQSEPTATGGNSASIDGDEAAVEAWGHLEIRERTGAGAFAEIYRAHDARLGRDVALKLLRPERQRASTASLVREGRLLAKLKHTNVVTVYGSDEHDGRVGIWMELVRGRTLRELLYEGGRLGPREAAAIGIDLCRALAAVHGQGIVHGDVKAENVMREDGGRIVLMDFGIGKDLSDAGGDAGSISGTPLYVAPELLRGAPPTIQSDAYAVGVLLFYLVSGTFPVTGRSLGELRQAHERRETSLLGNLRPDLPGDFVSIVERALFPDPKGRFENAGQMEQALRGFAAAEQVSPAGGGEGTDATRGRRSFVKVAAAAILLALGGLTIYRGVLTDVGRPGPVVGASRSVAVLPFRTVGPDSEPDYFSDGMTEDIIVQLSSISDLKVISRGSAFEYRNHRGDLSAVAEALDVATLLIGSVRRDDDRVRITSELVEAGTGQQLWAASYDRELEDVFEIQADVARSIATALEARLLPAEQKRIARAPTHDIDAYNLYSQGRFFWNRRTRADFNRALNHFHEAIELDPDYALAHTGIADSYILLHYYGYLSTDEAMPAAREALDKALALDPDLAEAHLAEAVLLRNAWEWEASEDAFQSAIELKSNDSITHHWYAVYLTMLGRTDSALAEIQRARELDPLSLSIRAAKGWIYHVRGEDDLAVLELVACLELDPDFTPARLELAKAYASQGELPRSIAELERITSGTDTSETAAVLAHVYALAGREADARAILSRFLRRGESVFPGAVAIIAAGLNEIDLAVEWLERAEDHRGIYTGFIKVEPYYNSLRADERFQRLLARIFPGEETPPQARM